VGRLAAGSERLGLEAPRGGALEAEVRALAAESPRSIIKVLVTRGAAVARGYAPSAAERPTRITLRYAWPEEDPALWHEGVRVRVADQRLGENPALAGLKHCNRLEQVLARAEWTDPGIAEALMYSSSAALISGTMSNVFLVRDERLLTPRLDRCGVAGVMRRVVLAEAAKAGSAAGEGALGGGGRGVGGVGVVPESACGRGVCVAGVGPRSGRGRGGRGGEGGGASVRLDLRAGRALPGGGREDVQVLDNFGICLRVVGRGRSL